MVVPKDTDFNRLYLRFTCQVSHDERLLGDREYIVFVGDEEKYRLVLDGEIEEEFVDGVKMTEVDPNGRSVEVPIFDTVLAPHELDIRVIVHYQVDFSRRNNEKEYQDLLKKSGITLMDIRIDNNVIGTKRQLTFADYVNEVGITEEEREARLW